MNKMERCEICSEDSSEAGKLNRVYSKGYESLIKQCRRISDFSLLKRLERKWTSNIPLTVHSTCQCHYFLKKPDVEEQEHAPQPKCQEVSQSVKGQGPTRFPDSERCIVCIEDIHFDERHPDRQQIMKRCEICNEDSSEAGKLQRFNSKGYRTIIKQCRRIGDSSLSRRLRRKRKSNIPMTVHRRCRDLFLQKKPDVEEQDHAPRPKHQKVSQSVKGQGPTRFPYSERCIICNEDIHFNERHPDRQQTIHRASTIALKLSLLRIASARKDSLGMAVKGHLEGMADLVAEEAVYHDKCYCTLYDVPGRHNKAGRPVYSSKENAFYRLCGWLDSEMESGVYTVSQLHEQMKTIVGDDLPVYHQRYLKKALERHYGNSIFITNQGYRKDIVYFRSCIADIRDYQEIQTDDEKKKKKGIIKTAASPNMNDIKARMLEQDLGQSQALVHDLLKSDLTSKSWRYPKSQPKSDFRKSNISHGPTTKTSNVFTAADHSAGFCLSTMVAQTTRQIFTEEEKSLLAHLIKEKPILECKKTDRATRQEKLKKWSEVFSQFNASDKVNKRSVDQLKNCWMNMKQRGKQHLDCERHSFMKTGGGHAYEPSTSQSVEDTISALLPRSYDPIESAVGDDMPQCIFKLDFSDNSGDSTMDCVKAETQNDSWDLESVGSITRPMSATPFTEDLSRPPSTGFKVPEVLFTSVPQQTFCPVRPSVATPKKAAAKNVQIACEMDVHSLKKKIETENLICEAAMKKQKFIDSKIQLLQEKHEQEMLLLDTQVRYWKKLGDNITFNDTSAQ